MSSNALPLSTVFDGWNGYQRSLVSAVQPLTRDQLAFRPAPALRSTGEIVRHIALGRVTWFVRMGAPGSDGVERMIPAWETDSEGNRFVQEEALRIDTDAGELVQWLEGTWQMINRTLLAWSVGDLMQSYEHLWNGQLWAVSHQWTLFRILAHDIHHGGELSLMLGLQGIEAFELGALGGHIVLPPPAVPPAPRVR